MIAQLLTFPPRLGPSYRIGHDHCGSTRPQTDMLNAALQAERERCVELVIIGYQAARLGVTCDLQAAIRRGASADKVREEVLNTITKTTI